MNLQWYVWFLWGIGAVTTGYAIFTVIWYTRVSRNVGKAKIGKGKTTRKKK